MTAAPDGALPVLRLAPVAASARVQVWLGVGPAEVPVAVASDDGFVRLRPSAADLPPDARLEARLVAVVTDGDVTRHVDERFTVVTPPARPPVVTTAEGYLRIGGEDPVVGSGPVTTYTVEVEPATGLDPHAVADEVVAALSDPRSWTGRGAHALRRVGTDGARVRVLVARPSTVDRLCARAGLNTAGIYSCWNGRFAALNLDRWEGGAAGFAAPLPEYRRYVVNHEVGHGLGYGHRGCPARGALAPVMMQQTKGTGACLPNAWPYP